MHRNHLCLKNDPHPGLVVRSCVISFFFCTSSNYALVITLRNTQKEQNTPKETKSTIGVSDLCSKICVLRGRPLLGTQFQFPSLNERSRGLVGVPT